MAAVAVFISSLTATAAFADDTVVTAPGDLSISGDLKVGSTVSIAGGAWTPENAAVNVVWSADGTVIDEPADQQGDANLALLPDMVGKVISADVTGTVDATTSEPVHLTTDPYTVTLGAFSQSPVPTLSGTPVVGSPVEALAGEWSPQVTDPAYQWSIDGSPIADATTSGYTPVAGDLGHALTVAVTATADGYTTTTETSDPVTVTAGTLIGQNTPSISGAVRVGSKLTAQPGTWAPAAASPAFQWKVAGAAVSTATTFTPTAAQRGKSLTLTVTASTPGYADLVRTTAPSTIGYGVISAPAPKLSGSAIIGQTLTSNAGTWSPYASKTYQWLRNGAVIPGARYSGYKVASADYGKRLSLRITGTASGYTNKTVTSTATAVVVKPFTRTTAPTITGTARVLSVLSAHRTAWSPVVSSYSWQWKRNGVAISGATGAAYRLTTADYGKKITVTLTGRRGGYANTARTSAATLTVGTPAAVITRNGTFKVGTQVKAGTYVAAGGANCYWEREDSHSGYSEGPWNDRGRVIVTIAATDKTFYTEGCGSWAPFVVLPGTPASSFSDGMFAVGSQVSAGTYVVSNASNCSWERLSDASGSDASEIAFGPFNMAGRAIVTISPKDKFFASSGCGTWTRLPATGTPATTATDGMYAIGVHLQPGHYQTTGRVSGGLYPGMCLAAALSGFGGTEPEFDFGRATVDSVTGKADIQLNATDKGFFTTGCGTWKRIGD